MSEKLGQEPAFSRIGYVHSNYDTSFVKGEKGMSKRFFAACMAMKGILSNDKTLSGAAKSGLNDDEKVSVIINQSYIFADELLKQENK